MSSVPGVCRWDLYPLGRLRSPFPFFSMYPRQDLISWFFACTPWILPSQYFCFLSKNTAVEQNGLHSDSFLHVYYMICHNTSSLLSFSLLPVGLFSDLDLQVILRWQGAKKEGSGDQRLRWSNRWAQEVSYKLCLMLNKLIRSQHLMDHFQRRNETEPAETITQYYTRGSQNMFRTFQIELTVRVRRDAFSGSKVTAPPSPGPRLSGFFKHIPGFREGDVFLLHTSATQESLGPTQP